METWSLEFSGTKKTLQIAEPIRQMLLASHDIDCEYTIDQMVQHVRLLKDDKLVGTFDSVPDGDSLDLHIRLA
jgi:hypothetical protein